eukprot:m.479067 g.479067  ORF g.479067 m.479067 type:complete len:60 (-) comp21311_c0_seq1:2903-3082(-)
MAVWGAYWAAARAKAEADADVSDHLLAVDFSGGVAIRSRGASKRATDTALALDGGITGR